MQESDKKANKNKFTPEKLSRSTELFSWQAPVRPFKKRTKDFYLTTLAVGVLVSIIVFILEDSVLPVFVVVALLFLVYMLTTVPPHQTEHKITAGGIVFGGKKYTWQELTCFWFTQRFGNDLLVVETTRLPSRLEMVIHPKDKERIRQILEEFIDLEEAEPSFMDKMAAWLSKRVPLEE